MVAAAILEDVHLLGDDVALVAHGTQEDRGILDDWRANQAVVEEAGDALRRVPDEAPELLIFWEQVVHASGCAWTSHAPSLRRAEASDDPIRRGAVGC